MGDKMVTCRRGQQNKTREVGMIFESGTLPETNSSPLKMDGWNTTFLLGSLIFRGHVSFREGSGIFINPTFYPSIPFQSTEDDSTLF